MEDVVSVADFEKIVQSSPSVAVFFWAPWSHPCKQLDLVFAELAKEYPNAKFLRVQAEEVSDITDRFDVTVVPYFVLLKQGAVVDKIEGANAAALTQAVQKHFARTPEAASKPQAAASTSTSSVPANGAATTAVSSEQRIKDLMNAQPVMLFMKGTPDVPRCGFSRKVVDALRSEGEEFGSFDILTDEAVRQGIKKISDWPTFPQLYVRGELLGGCDIVMEMKQSGELKETIEEMKARA
ncbi:probable Glutaredoxin-3 [Coccomyxa sp. Obi]|nr:probable Glutaredoxin-3 [Coccomyxa sp. Obi]